MKALFCVIIMGIGLSVNASNQDVKLEISQVRNDKGMIYVMVKSAQGAPPIYLSAKPSSNGRAWIQMPSMKEGEWEVFILHDENDNKQMDYREGVPMEGFAKMKVAIDNTDKQVVKVDMTYCTN